MRRLSEVLCDVVMIAEQAVAKPGHSRPSILAELARETRRAHALPVEGARLTTAGLVVVEALEQFYGYDHRGESQWLMLSGAALPLLRHECWMALVAERQAREESAR